MGSAFSQGLGPGLGPLYKVCHIMLTYNSRGLLNFQTVGFHLPIPPHTRTHTHSHTHARTHAHTHTHTHARTHSFCGQYWKGKKERKRMQENRKQEVENIRNFQITVNYCNY